MCPPAHPTYPDVYCPFPHSTSPPTHPSTQFPHTYLPIHPHICPFFCLSIHSPTYPSVHSPSIHAPTHLSIHPPLTLLAIHLSAISYLLSIRLSTSAIHTTHPSRHAAISPPIPLCSRTPSARLSLHHSTVPLPIQPCLELLSVHPPP